MYIVRLNLKFCDRCQKEPGILRNLIRLMYKMFIAVITI